MRVLDLFSGIGGFSLGLERAGMETVAFCEYDKKAQLVLKKHWPDVPIFDDVRKLNGKQFEGQTIDLICGGFPCQPFSVAGKQRGEEDDRHLWPEYFRLIQEIRPRWVIGENVAGLINMGLDQVLSDLESENYSTETFVIPALAVNAPHRRDRVWIVANSGHRSGRDGERGIIGGDGKWGFQAAVGLSETVAVAGSGEASENVAHPEEHDNRKQGGQADTARADECGREATVRPESERRCENVANSRHGAGKKLRDKCGETTGKGQAPSGRLSVEGDNRGGWWAVEPELGRVANGIPNRVDRLKQLGNAVVPQVVEAIGRAIMEAEGF